MTEVIGSAGWVVAQGVLVILIKKGLITPDEAIEMLDEAIQAAKGFGDADQAMVAQVLTALKESLQKKAIRKPN